LAGLIAIAPPARGVYRLVRGPSPPFAPPDWEYALADGTFGNRFDDPTAEDGVPQALRFRAIYCATTRIACFGETLARFRPSLSLLARLDAIIDEEALPDALAGAVDPDDWRRGIVPTDWRLRRRIGQTIFDPGLLFVDIAAPETMHYLRTALAPLATRLGLTDIDLGTMTGQQRRFTQGFARHVYDRADASGRPRFAGIRYLSRLNPEWECWAAFDRRLRHSAGWPGFPVSILADDPDLLAIASLFDLSVEVASGSFTRP